MMASTLEQLYEIDQLLLEKGWDGNLTNNRGVSVRDLTFSLFDRSEDNEEHLLLMHLVRNFFLCTDYSLHCSRLAHSIESVFHGERVILVPVSEKDSIKSGHATIYDLSRYLDDSKFLELHTLESLQSLGTSIDLYNIIVVDDFVGSGTQFRRFVKKSIAEFGIHPTNVYLYSIVIMRRARLRIADFCSAHFASVEFERALSDSPEISGVLDPLGVYDRIESRLSVGHNYHRGYLKSEALVSMKKTPNNTLPIFWQRNHSQGDDWPAIFPRG